MILYCIENGEKYTMIGYLGVFLGIAAAALVSFKRIKSGYILNTISCLIMLFYNLGNDPAQTALFVCYSIFGFIGIYNYVIRK
jgi:hypothetical protein